MKPEPKVAKRVCTLCGLDWGLHGEKPTAEKCVELLRAAELANLTLTAQWQGTTFSATPTPNTTTTFISSTPTPDVSYGRVPPRGNDDIGKTQ